MEEILTSVLEEAEWWASGSDRFTSQERSSKYPLNRRLGGPQIRSGRIGEEKVFSPARSRTLIVQPIDQSLYQMSWSYFHIVMYVMQIVHVKEPYY